LVPYLRVANVQRGFLDLTEVKLIEATPEQIEGLRLQVGDVLFNEGGDRDKLGRGWIWNGELPECIHQNHVFRARVIPALVDSKWLSHYGNSVAQKYFEKEGKQTTNLASIGLNKLKALPVVLPPLAEQRRIVAKLEELFSELDAGVEALRRAQRRLTRYRQALLQSAVTGELTEEWREQHTHDIKLGKLASGWPTGWRQVSVEQIAVQVDYGSSAKTQQSATGIPVVRMGNIQDGRIVMDDVKTLPINHPEFPKLLLQPGDLLFNRTNSAELVGKSAVFRGKEPTSFASYLIRVRLNDSCLPEWLAVFINSSFGRRWVASVASQQVGQANVNGSKLRALQFPLPTIKEQEVILAELDRRLSAADALEATFQTSLRRAERLHQSILERAFRGELVPQDPNDEPAEALLARLKATAADAPAPHRRGRPPKAEPIEPQPPRRRGRPRKAQP